VSALASSPFDAGEFPYAFLAAFGNKDTTIKRLRGGSSNSSDIPGGVLQRSNIHMASGNDKRPQDNLQLREACVALAICNDAENRTPRYLPLVGPPIENQPSANAQRNDQKRRLPARSDANLEIAANFCPPPCLLAT
jgi:hypothetical protein